ncbi:MAG: hypothetical protein ACXIUL_01350 [Wenzhouxiangella sp.]
MLFIKLSHGRIFTLLRVFALKRFLTAGISPAPYRFLARAKASARVPPAGLRSGLVVVHAAAFS